MPGKTYEYLRAGRPVYCMAAEGPAAELIRETGAGVVESSTDLANAASSLELFIDRALRDHDAYARVAGVLSMYDRRTIAGKISDVLGGKSHD
jgi:glycosyltransferase involved in cell wall biosynthesis